jgi:prephenate dehydratase
MNQTMTPTRGRLAFFGPSGTFTEEAARVFAQVLRVGPAQEQWVACPTIPDVLETVAAGQADFGVVPIENSLEGSVNITLDWLAHEGGITLVAEAALAISHNLLVRPGVSAGEIEGIISHPQALAQCRRYLRSHFPGVPLYPSESTAAAAATVAKDPRPLAAIGTRLAGRLYALEVLEEDIQDEANNRTRFVLVGSEDRWSPERQKELCNRHGHCKTSVLITLNEDRPGALYGVLACFAREQINLTRIESRPTRRGLGSYHFFVDLEGCWWDPAVQRAVACVHGEGSRVRCLGTYTVIQHSCPSG